MFASAPRAHHDVTSQSPRCPMKKLVASLVVISLTFVGVVTVFADNIKALSGMSADALSGETGTGGSRTLH